jgi:hypothetical protein
MNAGPQWLIAAPTLPIMGGMDRFGDFPRDYPTLGERMNDMMDRGMRIARRVGMAFGLSALLAIFLGAAVTDNGFVQILVTAFATLALWLPTLFAIVSIERWFGQRRRKPASAMTIDATATASSGSHWQRLAAAAPHERDRLRVLEKSLASSRQTFTAAQLDPDAHDLCVLIDRRLPELIDHQLDSLPPDDRGRKKQVAELVDLVEQFARHCGRKRDGDSSASAYQAEVLRRRFEERLSDNNLLN